MTQNSIGRRPGNAKFTTEEVILIREVFLTCTLSIEQISKKYDVDSKTMRSVLYNKTYHNPSYIIPSEVMAHYENIKGYNKLSKNLITSARERYSRGEITPTKLAKEYNISVTTASDLLNYKSHKLD
jgi:hypothetical protein